MQDIDTAKLSKYTNNPFNTNRIKLSTTIHNQSKKVIEAVATIEEPF